MFPALRTLIGLIVQRWLLMVIGLVFGLLTSAINHGFGPGSAYVSKVIGNGWVWLAAGLLACIAARDWRSAAVRGLAFYLPAVLAYYVSDVAAGVYSSPPFADPGSPEQFDVLSLVVDLGFYLFLSCITSCLLATLVAFIRRGGIIGVAAAVAVPGYIALSAFWLNSQWASATVAIDPLLIRMNLAIGVTALIVTVVVLVQQILGIALRSQRRSRSRNQRDPVPDPPPYGGDPRGSARADLRQPRDGLPRDPARRSSKTI